MNAEIQGLWVAILALLVGLLGLLVALVLERQRRRDVEMMNRQLESQAAAINNSRENGERVLRMVSKLVGDRLVGLGPTFRTALSHFIIEIFVKLDGAASRSSVLKALKEENPELDAAWAAIEPNIKNREKFVDDILESLRRLDLLEGEAIAIGSSVFHYGRPISVKQTDLGLTGRIAAHRLFVWAKGVSLALLSLFLGLMAVVSTIVLTEVSALFLPIAALALGIVYGVLRTIETRVRGRLSHESEFGVFFGAGVLTDRPAFVSFGEYCGAVYYVAPDPKSGTSSSWELRAWRRFSPNGRSRWDRLMDRESSIPEREYWAT